MILYPMKMASEGNVRHKVQQELKALQEKDREEAALETLKQMCQGMQACHDAGIAHLEEAPSRSQQKEA